MIQFFRPDEEDRIIRAIQEAEKHTSGEIRVHLEKDCRKPVLDEAARVFHKLKMDKTELRNGVLIFVAPLQKQFAIIGDQGINIKVPEHFWEDVRDVMQQHFRNGNFAEGLCTGIRMAGEKLTYFFPYQTDDTNELPDDISYG